jgi:hypothetical protein
MTTKIVRGKVLTFKATPRGMDGEIITPDSVSLYLNYLHENGASSTDPPILMHQHTDGSFRAAFDTSVAEPGAAFASIRAENPSAADDVAFTIIANAANPDSPA